MSETLERYPELVVVLFPLFWCALLVVVARLNGWARLAAQYRAWDEFAGRSWSFQSADIGGAGYSGILVFGANHRGLYVRVLLPFRPGHPPLLLPWDDLSATDGAGLFSRWVEFRFRRVPGAKVRVSKGLGDLLRTEAGSRWPGDEEKPGPIEPR